MTAHRIQIPGRFEHTEYLQQMEKGAWLARVAYGRYRSRPADRNIDEVDMLLSRRTRFFCLLSLMGTFVTLRIPFFFFVLTRQPFQRFNQVFLIMLGRRVIDHCIYTCPNLNADTGGPS
jgi:hypothetical protein